MGQDLDQAGGVLAVVPALQVVGGAGVGAAGIVVEALPPDRVSSGGVIYQIY